MAFERHRAGGVCPAGDVRRGRARAGAPATRPRALGAAFTTRPCERDDEPGVLALLNEAFGRWPRGIDGVSSAEHFAWKHRDCPFGPSRSLVAVLDGEVVGFTAWLPWLIEDAERVMTTKRGIDLAVAPRYHGQGLAGALIAASSRDRPAQAAFSWNTPNERSRPGLRRAGVASLGALPRYARARPASALGRRLRARRPGAPGRRPAVDASHAAAADRALDGSAAESVSAVLRDGVDVALLRMRGGRSTERLATVKDLPYLHWRYGSLPGYRAVRADRPGARLNGTAAIFRVVERHGLRVAHVCELICDRRDRSTARALLARAGRAARADLVACAFACDGDALRCGFARLPGGATLSVRVLRPDVALDPGKRAAWALSLGDVELL
jgi:GNAT superfamily N-acetyltransferase